MSCLNLFVLGPTNWMYQFSCCVKKKPTYLHPNSCHLFALYISYFPSHSPTLFHCCFPFTCSLSLSPSVCHFLFAPSLFCSSLFCSSLFPLVSFEVLNNERATLPVKLIGKFKLKLHGTVQHSRIFSRGPQRDGRRDGSIKSVVSMR